MAIHFGEPGFLRGAFDGFNCVMNYVPTETLYRRLRSRIIEHLELVSSAERQIAYQLSAATVPVSDELFNAWRDWVVDEAVLDEFVAPVFSSDEQLAVREFNATVNAVASRTPHNLPHITNFVSTSAWRELSAAASKALAVFEVRGMNPEDGEVS